MTPQANPNTSPIELRPSDWWKEQPEEMMALSAHIVDKLANAGITTIGQVREAGPDKLLEIEGIGKVALEEIKTWLRWLDNGKA